MSTAVMEVYASIFLTSLDETNSDVKNQRITAEKKDLKCLKDKV